METTEPPPALTALRARVAARAAEERSLRESEGWMREWRRRRLEPFEIVLAEALEADLRIVAPPHAQSLPLDGRTVDRFARGVVVKGYAWRDGGRRPIDLKEAALSFVAHDSGKYVVALQGSHEAVQRFGKWRAEFDSIALAIQFWLDLLSLMIATPA